MREKYILSSLLLLPLICLRSLSTYFNNCLQWSLSISSPTYLLISYSNVRLIILEYNYMSITMLLRTLARLPVGHWIKFRFILFIYWSHSWLNMQQKQASFYFLYALVPFHFDGWLTILCTKHTYLPLFQHPTLWFSLNTNTNDFIITSIPLWLQKDDSIH